MGTPEARPEGGAVASLTRVQDDFQAFMLRKAMDIEAHVVGTARVPISTRLGIYGDGYCLRLIEALQASFPALAKLLEEQDFATLGTAYVRANDSHFRSVRYYGAGLPDFLATQPEYAAAPVLAQLARWEWAMTEVFDAADAQPIGVEALGQVQPERWAELRFDFHPSVRRLALHWNAPQIWKALTEEAPRPQTEVRGEPVQWVLWRQALQTYFRSLEPAETQALDVARGGGGFGEICAGLSAHFSAEEIPVRAATFLRQWVESGLIVAVR